MVRFNRFPSPCYSDKPQQGLVGSATCYSDERWQASCCTFLCGETGWGRPSFELRDPILGSSCSGILGVFVGVGGRNNNTKSRSILHIIAWQKNNERTSSHRVVYIFLKDDFNKDGWEEDDDDFDDFDELEAL